MCVWRSVCVCVLYQKWNGNWTSHLSAEGNDCGSWQAWKYLSLYSQNWPPDGEMDSVKWSMFLVCLCFKGMARSLHCKASSNILQSAYCLFDVLICFLFRPTLWFSDEFVFFKSVPSLIWFCFLSSRFPLRQLLKRKPHLGQLRCHPQWKVCLDPVWWSPARLTTQIQTRGSLCSRGCGPSRLISSSITQTSRKGCGSIRIGLSCWETSDTRAVHWRLIPFNKVTEGLFISGLKWQTMPSFPTQRTLSPLQWLVSNNDDSHQTSVTIH